MRHLLSALFLFICALPVSAASWPASDSIGTNIGAAVIAHDPLFEPSGVVWHTGRQQLISVGDEGQVALLERSGSVNSLRDIGSHDLEDVTAIPAYTDRAYLLNENDSSILEYNVETRELTGRSWSGSSKITEVNGTTGAEGLAWVPDGYHPYGITRSGGLFYMGWQYDGDIYIFDVDLANSGVISFVEEIHMTSGYTDLSGLFFSTDTKVLYALYDGLNILEERTAGGTFLASYSVPGTNQEGVTLIPTSNTSAQIIIAEDSGRIMEYSGYPVSIETPAPAPEPTPEPTPVTIDADADGVDSTKDCNDNDPSVSAFQTYYLDADRDGLGSDTTISVCSMTAPTGYVTNSNDVYDNIPNAGVEIDDDGADNDGDGQIDENNLLSSNGAHPYYSTLSPSVTQYGTNIIAMAGASYGKITVRFADHSTYLYTIFSTTSTYTTQVQTVSNSGYILVTGKRRVAIVNGLNGTVVATHSKFSSSTSLSSWVYSVVGLPL